MPSRRRFIQFGATPAALALLPRGAFGAESDPARAAEFIRQTGTELAAVVGDATTPDEKRRRLQPFIDKVVDVDGVARFCLGRYWRQATPAQRQEYTALFHRVLLNNVVARVGDYRQTKTGQTKVGVIVGRPEPWEGEIRVPTVVEREGSPPANVVWVVQDNGGTLRIVDVLAEGTSLRLTVRNDYISFLVRHDSSIAALIDALRRQAES